VLSFPVESWTWARRQRSQRHENWIQRESGGHRDGRAVRAQRTGSVGKPGRRLVSTDESFLNLAVNQLGLVLGAVCIAFAPIFVKALGDFGPTVSGMYRTATGAVFLYGLYGWNRFRRRGTADEAGPSVVNSRGKLLLWCLFAGVLFSLDLYVWHRAVLLVGAGMGTILGNTQVFYLALMGLLFFRERLDWRYATAVPLAFVGIILLVTMGGVIETSGVDYWFGVGCGLATGLVYASYLLVLRRLQTLTTSGAVLILALITTVTTVILAVVSLLEGTLRLPRSQEWWPILGLGFVPQVIGWLLISRNIPRVDVSRGGLILLLQPALATVFGAIFFAEHLSIKQMLGAALTLFAVYLGSTRRIR